MTRPDPTDKELLEFVARFAGWGNLGTHDGMFGRSEFLMGWKEGRKMPVPDYLNSVDAWLRDVWPKITQDSDLIGGPAHRWYRELCTVCGAVECAEPFIANADARSRCLALYRALEGRLP